MLLLRLLLSGNAVLDGPSRAYALGLMAQVIASQRWGVPAGAPASVTVHVKNGWLPRAAHGWRLHSIGGVARPQGRGTPPRLPPGKPPPRHPGGPHRGAPPGDPPP